MVCFIVEYTDGLAYLIPMFSIGSWFLYFLQYLLRKYEERET